MQCIFLFLMSTTSRIIAGCIHENANSGPGGMFRDSKKERSDITMKANRRMYSLPYNGTNPEWFLQEAEKRKNNMPVLAGVENSK